MNKSRAGVHSTDVLDAAAYRARLYRLTFAAAALYNIAFGLWAALWPLGFFTMFELDPPRYLAIWACLGMVIGLYGVGYAYAAWRLDRATPFIAIGLAGKLLGPAGWVEAVTAAEWPIRTITLIVFNDVIWWMPFTLFLLEGTRAGARVRASAPYVCAALNLAAMIAMAAVLRFGTEIVPVVSDRISYISQHPVAWRAGWALWIAAAVSLVAFYGWWGSFIGGRRATIAVAIASAGLCCDLLAESLLIGWLPQNYETVAPLATRLTGGAANGLYTVSGIILTLSSRSLTRLLAVLAWTAWIAGVALTICALASTPIGIAISTTVLFAFFCPFVVLLGRHYAQMPAGKTIQSPPG